MRLRREIGIAGPSAIVSASAPSWSAWRPAVSSRARDDGASTVTRCPRARSPSATPATCSLTSCGCDQSKGETRQIFNASSLALASSELPRHETHREVRQPDALAADDLTEPGLDLALPLRGSRRDVACREHAV